MVTTESRRGGRVRICLAGAAGRMGSMVAKETTGPFVLVGAVESPDSRLLGKTLREAGVADSDIRLLPPERIAEAARDCDVYISFTSVDAELSNLPRVVGLGKPLVIGTTGFSPEQRSKLQSITKRVAAVVAPNFSVGANFLFALTEKLTQLPVSFDFSIVEAHHNRKGDAPSGTANVIAEIVKRRRRYTKIVNGRSGPGSRAQGELEVLSIRGGGIPGDHQVLAAGAFETLRLEHSVFSRSAFAVGALTAAKWVIKQKPGIYGMSEVLGLQ
jgi:4-hydroxy-tetrahydrodipicolinate reductase